MSTKVIIGVAIFIVIALFAYWLIPEPSTQPAPVDAGGAATTTGATGTTTSAGIPPPAGVTSTQPVAVAAARAALATKLGVDEKVITATKVETQTWSDGCLGLGGPAEWCTQALIDGYRVTLQASGKTYVYRTDTSGASVRAEAL